MASMSSVSSIVRPVRRDDSEPADIPSSSASQLRLRWSRANCTLIARLSASCSVMALVRVGLAATSSVVLIADPRSRSFSTMSLMVFPLCEGEVPRPCPTWVASGGAACCADHASAQGVVSRDQGIGLRRFVRAVLTVC